MANRVTTLFADSSHTNALYPRTKFSAVSDENGVSLESRIASLAATAYPVGSIYLSINNVDPATLFGGTWLRIKDTFLLAAGDTYTAGATGGEVTHSLTENEMPSHTHSYSAPVYSNWVSASSTHSYSMAASNSTTGETGGGQAHNNMPPYLAVYIWQRTA